MKIDFDDLCYYKIEHKIHGEGSTSENLEYVKGCKKGKKCKDYNIDSVNQIKTCQSNNDKLSKLTMDEECKYDLQCDEGLECINRVCSIKESGSAYKKGNFYFCPSGYNPVKIDGPGTVDSIDDDAHFGFICKKSSDYNPNGRYFYYNKDENQNYYSAPEFLQFPGEIVFYDQDDTAINTDNGENVNIKRYHISEVKTAPIASLDDGTFVIDPKTCKSGFAVKYIGDKSLSRPSNYMLVENDQKYYRCVTVEEVDQKRCLIKYNLDDNDITLCFNDNELTSANCQTIDIELEMFEKFKDKMSKCTSNKYDEEPITCGREDLRKYAYFYEYPEKYLLYKDENQIIDYIIQDHYGSSSYLMINLIFLLFLFFL